MKTGSQGRLLIDTSASFDGSSFAAEFLSESIVQDKQIINSAGIRGTRSHASERNRYGNEKVSGTIEFEASRALLDNILPGALGAAESSDVFAVAETLPDLYFLIDKGVDICLVSAAKIGTMTISGTQNEIVKVSISIEAESMTWGQSWPGSPPSVDTTKPYFYSDLGQVTLEGTARDTFAFSVTVDNVLIADQWANNLTRDGLINASDRIVTTSVTVNGGDTSNADLTSGTVTGAAVSFVLTNADETGSSPANSSLTIACGKTAFANAAPVISSKGQILLPLTGQSRATGTDGSSPDIKFTNVAAA